MLPLLGHAVVLLLWFMLMRWERRSQAQHRAAMNAHLAAVRSIEAEHDARNAEFLRTLQRIEAARTLPTHRPAARPS